MGKWVYDFGDWQLPDGASYVLSWDGSKVAADSHTDPDFFEMKYTAGTFLKDVAIDALYKSHGPTAKDVTIAAEELKKLGLEAKLSAAITAAPGDKITFKIDDTNMSPELMDLLVGGTLAHVSMDSPKKPAKPKPPTWVDPQPDLLCPVPLTRLAKKIGTWILSGRIPDRESLVTLLKRDLDTLQKKENFSPHVWGAFLMKIDGTMKDKGWTIFGPHDYEKIGVHF